MGPKASLDAVVNRNPRRPCCESNAGRPAHSLVSNERIVLLSKSTILSILTHHRQNPTEIICLVSILTQFVSCNHEVLHCRSICMRMYVSGLAAWSENCKWYSSLPLCAVVSLFCELV
jgi:hypothetical protein